jgi:hypothetical protein
MVLDFIFDLVLAKTSHQNYEALIFGVFQKLVFQSSKYFESPSVKKSSFQKRFFIKIFTIEASTNAKRFLKVQEYFCATLG